MTELLSGDLLTLYSAKINTDGDEYTITVPKREVEIGALDSEKVHKVAILDTESEADQNPSRKSSTNNSTSKQYRDTPPVKEGETIKVEIESIGDHGDGIAKVDKGYVVIIPDTSIGDTVSARITETQENVAFAEVMKRHKQPA